jgi:hypothetical protein
MAELDIVMKLRAIAHLSPPSISGVTALNPESREAIEAGAHEIERLRAALREALEIAEGPSSGNYDFLTERRARIDRLRAMTD